MNQYSRVYHSIVDDPKFATIYDDDRRLATWLRLLIVAEQAYPASAYVPAGTHRRSLLALVDAELIDLGPGSRFRIHGLDAERTRRSDAARVGGLASGRSRAVERTNNERSTEHPTKSNLAARAQASSRLVSSSPEEDRARDPWDDPEGEAVTWLAKHGCALPPHSGYYRHLVTMVEAHGINAVIGMFDRFADAGMKAGDVKGYVFGARDALDSKTRPSLVDVVKAERGEDVRAATKRAVENTRRYIAELKGADA